MLFKKEKEEACSASGREEVSKVVGIRMLSQQQGTRSSGKKKGVSKKSVHSTKKRRGNTRDEYSSSDKRESCVDPGGKKKSFSCCIEVTPAPEGKEVSSSAGSDSQEKRGENPFSGRGEKRSVLKGG